MSNSTLVAPISEDSRVSNREFDSDGFAVNCARKYAWHLVHCYGFHPQEVPDFEQELLMKLLEVRDQYNPDKGNRKGFIAAVIRNRAISYARYRTACFRDSRTWGEFQEPTAQQSDQDARIDLKIALEHCTPEQQQIAGQLAIKSKQQVGDDLGLNRSKVFRVSQKIAAVFESCGINRSWLGLSR